MRNFSEYRWSLIVVLGMALVHFPRNVLAQECELNCKTKNCSPEGQCICDMPSPDSISTSHRTFFGGVFCDVESVMCDGTNTFWCQSGGTCNELVPGEKYTCSCRPGFAGEHCNFAGELCGNLYCFNGGICKVDYLTGTGSCDCPGEFLGAANCSVSTPTVVVRPPPESNIEEHHGTKLSVSIGIVLAVLMSISCVCGLALKCYKQSRLALSQSRFHELRQVQMNDGPDFYDEDEEHDFLTEHETNRNRSTAFG